MNRVKRFKELQIKLQSVGLNKLKREIWLRVNVHADNLKSGPVVSDCNPAGAAK